MKKILLISILVSVILFLQSPKATGQKFEHPGIDQTAEDLIYMKEQVEAGNQPWKDAFERLKTGTDLKSPVVAFAHVQRGPYGNPNIGGGELRKNANMAYDCALLWYITGEKAYAAKAIEIINAWSPVLQDFDYNDAKLLAGWTGHLLCNAAEILRYTKSGWLQKDIESFTNMLMTVYYPLMRFYYPQANGNWDGAIIHSILAIAVFTDNNEMFENAIDHFLHGPVNGSLFKYIYPNGQCQETARDQAHVQLGLGEFAGAARIAYTQGVDLFRAGNNRIALGYEYTAGILLGSLPHCYDIIAEKAMNIRDDYEYVYRHYASVGLILPNTKSAADSVRSKSTRNTLTAIRAPEVKPAKNQSPVIGSKIGYPAGALSEAKNKAPDSSVIVNPGESLQEALNSISGTGKWVIARSGIHTLPTTLSIPSGITLAGEGISTILFLDPKSGVRDALVSGDPNLHDVTICDLVIEGNTRTDRGSDPNTTRSYRNPGNRGGIMFLANKDNRISNINLINVTVRNCTYNGVFINGAAGVNIICCDFNENGSSVVPGPRLQHNLLLTHCSKVSVKDSRISTSPYGSGIAVDHCSDAKISNCEVARNGYYGILISESSYISISGSLIEANDRSGVMVEFLNKGSDNVSVRSNHIQFNNGNGVESYAARKLAVSNNVYESNGKFGEDENISNDKFIIMQ